MVLDAFGEGVAGVSLGKAWVAGHWHGVSERSGTPVETDGRCAGKWIGFRCGPVIERNAQLSRRGLFTNRPGKQPRVPVSLLDQPTTKIMKTTPMMIVSLACLTTAVLAQRAPEADKEMKPGMGAHAGYDADGDGTLSDSEKMTMEKESKSMAMAREKMMLKKYDKDGDGKLSDDESAKMAKDRAEMMEKRQEKKLAKWDKDKDGKLSDEETMAMHKKASANRMAVLKKYDANKDGMLDDTEIETGGKASDSDLDDMLMEGGRGTDG